ncbi:MAG: hypothetical protein HZB51_16100 [Chloroflexi bacterium]|nr:hypothetical protein [Chloroflexota bacterium]
MNPYILMTAFFLSLAGLGALETMLANLQVVAWFNGLRWLRVHFVTLGVLVELVFGFLPTLVAARVNKPHPTPHWGIWFFLNAGLMILIVGIPLVNAALIFAGGTLIFLATILLLRQLSMLDPKLGAPTPGRLFYLAGLIFLSLGIIFGTGLWLGWGEFLRAAAPKEIHLHANLWGFTSLTFAGLLIDLYPGFAKRPLALPRSLDAILFLFIAGGTALVVAPWIGDNLLMLVGLLLHHAATGLLVFNVVKPLIGDRNAWNAGQVHLIAAYAWILAGLAVVPITVFGTLQVPLANVEAQAPLILVFGWVLQFAFALAPYIFARVLAPDQPAQLGGNRVSLFALNAGTLCIVAAIISETYQATFGAIAFGLWAIAILPVVRELWEHTRSIHSTFAAG